MMASWVVIRLVVTGKRIGEMRCINLVAVWLRKDTHNGFLRVKVNVQKRYWKLKVNYRKIKAPKGTEMTDSIRNSCRGSLF